MMTKSAFPLFHGRVGGRPGGSVGIRTKVDMTVQTQFGDGLLEKMVVSRQVRVVAAMTLSAENVIM